MANFKPGEKVRFIASIKEVNDLARLMMPISAEELFGQTVTILEQPVAGLPFYCIEEDGGSELYPAGFFSKINDAANKQHRRHWTDQELHEARRLVCNLLVHPDRNQIPDASYRFVDLVTPYLTGELSEGNPRMVLIRAAMKGLEVDVYSGIASPKDEPNVVIGMLVCLCKAKGVAVPDWVMHPAPKRKLRRCK